MRKLNLISNIVDSLELQLESKIELKLVNTSAINKNENLDSSINKELDLRSIILTQEV